MCRVFCVFSRIKTCVDSVMVFLSVWQFLQSPSIHEAGNITWSYHMKLSHEIIVSRVLSSSSTQPSACSLHTPSHFFPMSGNVTSLSHITERCLSFLMSYHDFSHLSCLTWFPHWRMLAWCHYLQIKSCVSFRLFSHCFLSGLKVGSYVLGEFGHTIRDASITYELWAIFDFLIVHNRFYNYITTIHSFFFVPLFSFLMLYISSIFVCLV